MSPPSVRSGLYLFAVLIFLQIMFPAVLAGPENGQAAVELASGSQLTAAEYEAAGIALMGERNWSALLAITNDGLAQYPGDGELYCLRGYALRKTGQYVAAADNVSRGIAIDPRPARYANRAYAYLAQGRYQDALDDAEAAISMYDGYTTAYGVKTIALLGMGNVTEASDTADAVLKLDPESALYWQLKGRTAVALGNCSGAREAFNRSLAINPEYDLPWPEFGNATADLRKAELQCAGAGSIPGTSPTKAPVSVFVAGAALVLGALSFKKRS